MKNESKLNTPGSTRGTLRSTPSMSVNKSDEAPTQNFRGDHYIPGTGTSPDSMIQDSLTDLIGFGEEELDRDEEAFLDEVDDVNLYDAYDPDLGEPPSLEPILDGDDEEEKFATTPPRSPEMMYPHLYAHARAWISEMNGHEDRSVEEIVEMLKQVLPSPSTAPPPFDVQRSTEFQSSVTPLTRPPVIGASARGARNLPSARSAIGQGEVPSRQSPRQVATQFREHKNWNGEMYAPTARSMKREPDANPRPPASVKSSERLVDMYPQTAVIYHSPSSPVDPRAIFSDEMEPPVQSASGRSVQGNHHFVKPLDPVHRLILTSPPILRRLHGFTNRCTVLGEIRDTSTGVSTWSSHWDPCLWVIMLFDTPLKSIILILLLFRSINHRQTPSLCIHPPLDPVP